MSVGADTELLLSAQSCGVGGSVGFAHGQRRVRCCLQLEVKVRLEVLRLFPAFQAELYSAGGSGFTEV